MMKVNKQIERIYYDQKTMTPIRLYYVVAVLSPDVSINIWPPEIMPVQTDEATAVAAFHAINSENYGTIYRLVSYAIGSNGYCDPMTKIIHL